MLDQEDDTEFDDECLTANKQLTHFSKAREKILGKVKGADSPSVQGNLSSEEDFDVRKRVPSRTKRL